MRRCVLVSELKDSQESPKVSSGEMTKETVTNCLPVILNPDTPSGWDIVSTCEIGNFS
jgi:hypothetical protein